MTSEALLNLLYKNFEWLLMIDAELIYAYLLSNYAHIFRYLHLKVEKILFPRRFFWSLSVFKKVYFPLKQ